jgi:hypothetical protein
MPQVEFSIDRSRVVPGTHGMDMLILFFQPRSGSDFGLELFLFSILVSRDVGNNPTV